METRGAGITSAQGCAPSRSLAPDTPVADALLRLSRRRFTSFHGLPISAWKVGDGDALDAKYEALFGRELMHADLAITGPAFDSFFFPKRAIAAGERLAAQAFGAAHSLFVTAGTSMAIQIGIEALVQPQARVLVDRCCHQSVHLALDRALAAVTYVDPLRATSGSGRAGVDGAALLQACAAARRAGRPFTLVVLTAASYDGVMVDMSRLLQQLWAIEPQLQLLVDEAWSSHAYFHPRLRPLCAMAAAGALREGAGGSAAVVSVQSAHKSLNALRQGSFVHAQGDAGVARRLRAARFALHTTSPSYPILGSLDLARAQMQQRGEALVDRALTLAQQIRQRIEGEPALGGYAVDRDDDLLARGAGLLALDPTRISLNLSRLGLSTSAFKRILAGRHGIYLNRSTPSSVLLNVHIGIDAAAVDRFLGACAEVQASVRSRAARRRQAAPAAALPVHAAREPAADCAVSRDFLIPYPPGVPAVVPGETLDAASCARLVAAAAAGAEVIRLAGRNRLTTGSS